MTTRSGRARPPATGVARRRRRWYLVPVIGIPALLGIGLLWANPAMPPAPELEAVKLALPSVPAPAPALERLLRGRPPVYERLAPALEQAAAAALKEGRWPANPDEVRKALGELNPPLEQVRAALLAPGCLPEEQRADPAANELSYLPLTRGVRLLVLRSVVDAEAGQPGQAARGLVHLFDRLLALEQRCAPNLVAALSLGLALQHIGGGFGFLLARPTLDSQTEVEVWRRLLLLEQRASPVPNALRWEARWMRETLDRRIDRTTVEEAARGKRGRPLSWPFFDRGATLALGERLARRSIWAAEQPLGAAVWRGPTPEAAYLERLERQPRALFWLRYNGAGMALTAVAQPDWRRYSLKWHRDRCLAAARRARWIEELRGRGRQPPGEAGRVPAMDPFRHRRFTGHERDPLCGVPRDLVAVEVLKVGGFPPPLPPAPL